MAIDSNNDRFKQVAPVVYRIRGQIINETIFVERLIDRILAKYFAADVTKQMQLLEMLFCTNRIIYESKRAILKQLFESEWGNEIFNDLQSIGEHRNVFAHYIFNSTTDAMQANDRVGFIKFAGSEKPIWYTLIEIKGIVELIGKTTLFFISKVDETGA